MTPKELRQKVLEFLTTKQIVFDASQRTAYLLKLAVRNGFETPSELPEQTPDEIKTELIQEEIPEEIEETPDEIPEEKPVKKITGRPRKAETEIITTVEKEDNSIYWLLALAALTIVALYFIKKRNNGTPEEN